MLPRVAVIIVTYRNAEASADLARLLPTLEKVDYPLDRWEIVVVDNPSSTGNCREILQDVWRPRSGRSLPRLTVIGNDANTGFAGGNNQGTVVAKEHGAAYVFLLNQDTDVDSGFLRWSVERAEADRRVAIVQSLLLLGGEPGLVNSWGNVWHFLGYSWCGGYRETRPEADRHFAGERRRGNADLEIACASGAASLVRLAALGAEAPFDENFFLYHEDADLSLRLRSRGWRVVIEPRSVVRHHYVFARSASKFRWMERNRYAVMLSFYRWPTWALIMPWLLAVELAALVFAWRGGWLAEKLAAYRSLLAPETRQWLRARRAAIQARRVVSDRELLRSAVGAIDHQETGGGLVVRLVANPVLSLVWSACRLVMWW